jgi:type VI secretion system protein ImpH
MVTGTLGDAMVIGERVWDCQHKFRVRLGPMDFKTYQQLLPGTPGFLRLRAWIKNYVGLALDWDAQLCLRAREVPQLKLGTVGQLGWSTWLISRPQERDRDELIVNGQLV